MANPANSDTSEVLVILRSSVAPCYSVASASSVVSGTEARTEPQYRPVAIAIDPNPALSVDEVVYPRPMSYLFKPLSESVLVYERPFRLTLGMKVGAAPAQLAALTAESRLTIKGQLTYQACDDTVCYLPTSVPFALIVPTRPVTNRN